MATLQWREMRPSDIDGVVSVARVAFPNHPESRACFEERLALNPSGCFALSDEGGRIEGYLIAYPWTFGSAPALDSLIGALPAEAELIYLHDLALAPAARGQKLAEAAVDRLVDRMKIDWRRIALVAVNEAAPFWERQGFVVSDDPAMAAKLASYGEDARYMVRNL